MTLKGLDFDIDVGAGVAAVSESYLWFIFFSFLNFFIIFNLFVYLFIIKLFFYFIISKIFKK
jgi:hypothetical protein